MKTVQILRKIDDRQYECDRLLEMEPKIFYSSYLDESGSRLGEAIRNSISRCERLTMIVLPLHLSKESLVLVVSTDCDLTKIVEKTKKLFSVFPANPLIFS